MILTFKIKHNQDYTQQLKLAKKVAEFAINNRDKLSSKYVKHIGLHSAISCQVLRKYGRDTKCKQVKNVNLIIPNQQIRLNKQQQTIYIIPLKLEFKYQFWHDFTKVNQIEIDHEYLYISVNIVEQDAEQHKDKWIGVDLNATRHCAVFADSQTGKIRKLGKQAHHVHNKYKHLRRQFQTQGRLRALSSIKHRERNIVKDINHKISKEIVKYAKENHCGIKLEDLAGIRNNKKHAKSFNYILNSWSFYELQQFIKYKAKLQGVVVAYVDPRYTSQTCSICGNIGTRTGDKFVCYSCGHKDHSDVNGAFEISKRVPIEVFFPNSTEGSDCLSSNESSHSEYGNECLGLLAQSAVNKGSTDTPVVAMVKSND